MEEWILYVLGKAGGVPDMKILVQIQASKWAKSMVECLAHGGFDKLLGPHKQMRMSRMRLWDTGHSHRHIEVTGLRLQGKRVNDFWIYVQLPNNNPTVADNCVLAMMSGQGLRVFLGPYCKNIVVKRVSETHVGAFEELGGGIKVQ